MIENDILFRCNKCIDINNKKYKEEKFDNIIDLKDRSLVQMKKKVISDEIEEDNLTSKICSEFCVLVENIITLLEKKTFKIR